VINTLLLLTSSLCVVLGMKSVRGRLAGAPTRAAPWLFGGALACGLGFSAMKFLEYGEKAVRRHHPGHQRLLHVLLHPHRPALLPPDPGHGRAGVPHPGRPAERA